MICEKEKEFKRQLKLLRDEIYRPVRAYTVWKTINGKASKTPVLHTKMSEYHSFFWSAVSDALQSTCFITLGRLFDDHPDSFSVHKFFIFCCENREIFSRNCFIERKRKEYPGVGLQNVYEPSDNDFREIRKKISQIRKAYDRIYKRFRIEVAHNTQLKEPTESAPPDEFEEILCGLLSILDYISDLYSNGTKFDFGYVSYDRLHSPALKEGIKKTEDLLDRAYK